MDTSKTSGLSDSSRIVDGFSGGGDLRIGCVGLVAFGGEMMVVFFRLYGFVGLLFDPNLHPWINLPMKSFPGSSDCV